VDPCVRGVILKMRHFKNCHAGGKVVQHVMPVAVGLDFGDL
jgi:hypothetical protein